MQTADHDNLVVSGHAVNAKHNFRFLSECNCARFVESVTRDVQSRIVFFLVPLKRVQRESVTCNLLGDLGSAMLYLAAMRSHDNDPRISPFRSSYDLVVLPLLLRLRQLLIAIVGVSHVCPFTRAT